MNKSQTIEWIKCSLDPAYFITKYCQVYDPTPDKLCWLPFDLWPDQTAVIRSFQRNNQTIILKARQLGITWLVVAYSLWTLFFLPGSIVLLFSLRENEAIDLLARIHGSTAERIGGMYDKLPEWMKQTISITVSKQLEMVFSNGSTARAFPATKRAGRSFTATIVIVDEADFLPYFQQLMTAVRPTIDAGGKIITLSTSDKEKPASEFKRLFKEANVALNNWKPIFLPWSARPDRNEAWYQKRKQDYTQDDLWQEYPATIIEALAGRSEGKRFSPASLIQCFTPAEPCANGPAIPGLVVYKEPVYGRSYLIGCDTSEGDVTSDPSPFIVFDVEDWSEVALCNGVFEPSILAGYLCHTSDYFNNAIMCVERNNHGHAVILAIEVMENEDKLPYNQRIYISPLDNKAGWYSSLKYKTLAFNHAADTFNDLSCTIRSEVVQLELANIEAATLKAPEGETDDLALACIIGLAGLRWPSKFVPAALGQATARGWL